MKIKTHLSYLWAAALLFSSPAAATPLTFFADLHNTAPRQAVVPPVVSVDVGDDPRNPNCEVSYIEVPFYSPVEAEVFFIDFVQLVPKSKTPVPGLALLPNSNGATIVESDIAGHLCRHGFAVAFIRYPRLMPTLMEDIGLFARQEILATRALFDHFQAHPKIDGDRLGLYGVSYGAVMGSLLLALEPRAQAAILVAGGADVADIMAHSADKFMEKFRKDQFARHAYPSLENFKDVIRANNPYDNIDPELGLHRFRDKVFQVVISNDKSVPTKNQRQLWETLGRPKKLELQGRGLYKLAGAHVAGIVEFMDHHLATANAFLNRHFAKIQQRR